MINRLEKLFGVQKPVIGMIHLAGRTLSEKLDIAQKELEIYKESGIDGAILEDYHATPEDVLKLLKQIEGKHPFPLGINILRNPYLGFEWASQFNLKYVQLDSVYDRDLDLKRFSDLREQNPNIMVLGGVRFKGVKPTGRTLNEDIMEGMRNSDAIVTTGKATGHAIDTSKLIDFKYSILLDVPLIIGSGLNRENAYIQFLISDGAIVGSYFKGNDTRNIVISSNCKFLMDEVFRLRNDI